MITLLIIAVYIGTIFLTRYLNGIVEEPYVWLLWFIPFINLLQCIVLVVIILEDSRSPKFWKWFTFKNRNNK